jgi:hypothetical protein
VEVAGHHVHATEDLLVVAHPIAVGIRFTAPTAHAEGVHLVALAIAIAQGQEITPTLVHRAGTVANATFVQVSEAGVDVVANAIHVQIQGAFSPAHANLVKLVAFAIAIALRNGLASAFVDRTRAVADATIVEHAHAVVRVVAHPVTVLIRGAVAATHAQSVELVAVAISVACRDVGATALEDSPFTATHAAFVQLVSVAIAIACGHGITSTFVDVPRTVAHATRIDCTHAVVLVVAHPVAIRVSSAVAATHAQGVKLVAVAIAVAFRDVLTTALEAVARSVAHAARVVGSHAIVHVVTHAVAIGICRTIAAAHAKGIEVQARTVVQRGSLEVARVHVGAT